MIVGSVHIEISFVLQNTEAGYLPLMGEIIEFTVELQNNVGRLALKCDRYLYFGGPGAPKTKRGPIFFKGVPQMGAPNFFGGPRIFSPRGAPKKKTYGRGRLGCLKVGWYIQRL